MHIGRRQREVDAIVVLDVLSSIATSKDFKQAVQSVSETTGTTITVCAKVGTSIA